MAARLKVFTAAIGFHETVVAASSRKAALAAWGVHRDLFADGEARESDVDGARDAAMAQPGVVLRRPLGSSAAFKPAGEDVGASAPAGPTRKAKPPPSRTALDRAEAELAGVEAAEAAALAEVAARRTALDEEEREVRAEHDARRATAEAALAKARDAYRRAGGKP